MGDSAYLALLHVAWLVVLSKNAGCDNVAALAATTPATRSYCSHFAFFEFRVATQALAYATLRVFSEG